MRCFHAFSAWRERNAASPADVIISYLDEHQAGVANFMTGLAQLLAGQGIRASSVAPGSRAAR